MKTLKTGFFAVLIAISCITNVQAQENARGKLKGKVTKSSDSGMLSISKDTLSEPSTDLGKKGLNAVNVKLARGIDKKDIRRNANAIPDSIPKPALRKGINEKGLKKGADENTDSSYKDGEDGVSHTRPSKSKSSTIGARAIGVPASSQTNMN